MRLEKIKLAGFKSFVDPTTVVLPSNLVGIIGHQPDTLEAEMAQHLRGR